MTELSSPLTSAPTRRAFLSYTGCLAVTSAWASTALSAFGGQARVTLPFDNGERGPGGIPGEAAPDRADKSSAAARNAVLASSTRAS